MVIEYMAKAAGAWFLGFFPFAEIYVAVPAAIASGLDDVSVIFWAVLGNFTPILVINYGYEWLLRYERVRTWLGKIATEGVKARINRYGFAFVLLVTPWTGVWAMAATAKALGMESRRFILAAFISILVYAVLTLMLIRLGLATLSA